MLEMTKPSAIARDRRAITRGHSASRVCSGRESYASASSAPLAQASAAPLSTRFTMKSAKTMSCRPAGMSASTSISSTMSTAAVMTSGLRPKRSASAPLGTSSTTLVSAHTTFSAANSPMLSPRSRNSTVKTG